MDPVTRVRLDGARALGLREAERALDERAVDALFVAPGNAGTASIAEQHDVDVTSGPAVVALALDRMAEFRLRRPNPLAGAGEELLACYAGLEADFFEFLRDALAFARSVVRQRGG